MEIDIEMKFTVDFAGGRARIKGTRQPMREECK